MRLLIYSYFPVLADCHLGGAQRAMYDLIIGCLNIGHDVSIICPESPQADLLRLNGRLKVLPVLKERASRPLFLHERFSNLQQIAKAALDVDVICTFDRGFPLRVSQPIILIAGNLSYKAEMESLWSFSWDALITPSQYLYSIAQKLVGPTFWEGEPPPIKLIPCGVDTYFFCASEPEALRAQLSLSKSKRYLLCPHRPDPNKGFNTALKVLSRLNTLGEKYQLLIPLSPTYKSDVVDRRFYASLNSMAEGLNIGSSVIFHDWICRQDLPAYFSLGEWCLSLSIVPEGFGLTPAQSISCGTPVIATKAGALAQLCPLKHGIEYVDFEDVDQIVSIILKGLPATEVACGQAYIKKHYSTDQFIRNCLQCFESTRKNHALYNPLNADSSMGLSPWCHLINDEVVWHDYRMRKYKLTRKEMELIKRLEQRVSLTNLSIYSSEIAKLLAQGILLPGRIN